MTSPGNVMRFFLQGGGSQTGLILALDDYHTITEPAIHAMMSSLIAYLPQGVHLALATRSDPSLPLARMRARREMTELRSADLRFTGDEALALLEATGEMSLRTRTAPLAGQVSR